LLEGSFDSLVFALIKSLDEFLDTLCGIIQISTSFEKIITLFGEIRVLLERFLVDMGEFLE
jgi:hypothetical protein